MGWGGVFGTFARHFQEVTVARNANRKRPVGHDDVQTQTRARRRGGCIGAVTRADSPADGRVQQRGSGFSLVVLSEGPALV